jgi:serine/threonine protein kinase
MGHPQRLGRYRVVAPLGEGGMGVVFRGEDTETGEPVALKTVRVPYGSVLAGLRCEIHALTRVRHPGVVRIVDEGVEEGLPWYAMELLEGRTLEGYLRALWRPKETGNTLAATLPGTPSTAPVAKTAGRLDLAITTPAQAVTGPADEPAITAASSPRPAAAGRLGEALALVRRLCGPLAFLHGTGIVHRDLKPANVFIRDDDSPVLMDFGLVSRAEGAVGREVIEVAGEVAGTAAYISPEQIDGRLVDARTDLYALGCILYEIVTGSHPFTGKSVAEIIYPTNRGPVPTSTARRSPAATRCSRSSSRASSGPAGAPAARRWSAARAASARRTSPRPWVARPRCAGCA